MLRLVLTIIFFGTFAHFTQANDTTRLTLMFMGDIMQHGQQLKAAYNKETGIYDYRPVFRHVSPIIENADLAIANLELTLAGPPYSGYPQFCAPDELAVALKEAGIDVLVTANNHSLDRYDNGLERTIRVLDSLEIPHTGTFLNPAHREKTYPLLIEKKGIRLAILNYTYGTNGIRIKGKSIVNYTEAGIIKKDLAEARSRNPDLVIVVMHWGKEYQREKNKEQEYLAELCFAEGANLVIGSHPHVIQPVDWRNSDQLVAWSLGNFISNQRKRYTDGGLMLEVEVTKSETTRITDVGHYFTYVHKTTGPDPEFFLLAPGVDGYTRTPKLNANQLAQMDQFMQDSRDHLSKNNSREIHDLKELNYQLQVIGPGGEFVQMEPRTQKKIKKAASPTEVRLMKKPGKELQIVYRVQVLATSREVKIDPTGYDLFIRKDESSGLLRYRLGAWTNRREAEQALKDIQSQPGWEDAFIVTEKNN